MRKRARRPPDAGRALALAALFLLAGAGRAPVLAAPVDPDLSTDGLRRAGPFHLRPYLLLKDAGYDDNIRFDAAERRGDSTATAGLALDGLLLFGDRGGLRFNQELDYVAFGRETDLNHWNGSARARGLLKVRKAILFLEDRFASVRERPNTEIDQRLRRDTNAVTLGIRSLREGRFGYRASVRREAIDYASGEPGTEDLVRRLSRDESALVVTGELRVRPKTTLLLEGVVERIAFEDPAEARDARATALLPGVRFDPSAAIQGEFRLGRIALEALDRSGGDFDGTIGWGAISARVGTAGRLKTRFRRDVEFSARTESLYYVATDWSAAWEQFFTRRLSAEILYGRGSNRYPSEGSAALPVPSTPERLDRLTTRRAAILYRLNDRLALQAAAYRLRRDSNDDALDRERNAYTVGTTIDF